MRELFTREIAVEKGMRKDTIIDKGIMKRPINIIFTKKAELDTYKNGFGVKYVKNIKKFYTENKQYNIDSHSEAYRTVFKDHKEKQRQIDELGRRKESLKLLVEDKDFKKKVFVVYVEKQHGSICSLRDISVNGKVIIDIDIAENYDLAGRVVFIDMSKKNEAVTIHRITSMFSE